MAVDVSGPIRLSAIITDVRTAITGASNERGSRVSSVEAAWLVASGTAANLADKVWSNTSSPLTGATDSIDLAGTLTDAFGALVTFAKVRGILFVAAAANTTTLTLSRIATAGAPFLAADGDAVAPISGGGFYAWADPAAGFVVTATSDDIISVVNSAGATATYTILIVGTSA